MALSTEELDTIHRLATRHDAEIPQLEEYDRYYEGTQPFTYMHPEVLREVADRIAPVIIFWPQMAIDSMEERLRHEGFKTGDKGIDKELWRVWTASEMQLGFRMAVVDSLVMRRSFLCVGANEDDKNTPLVTAESPLEVFAETDPRTRKVRSALRRTTELTADGRVAGQYGTLYQPNATIWLEFDGGWREIHRDPHGLGEVPVVPLINRPRLRAGTRAPRDWTPERMGRSDLDPYIPLSNAANKQATDMMVAGEFVAIPLRGIFGIGPDDLKDQDGNPVTVLQAVMGRLFTISDAEAKGFEFAAAQLANFATALRELAHLFSAVSGLPPHYLGMSSENPASADAIAASEARLNTRAERKQDSLTVGVRRAARLIRRFQTGRWPDDLDIRIDWRNVRTPTIGAMADAAVKLFTTSPKPIVPLLQTRQGLGFDDETIAEMEREDEKAEATSPTAKLLNGLSDTRVIDDPDPEPLAEPVNAGA